MTNLPDAVLGAIPRQMECVTGEITAISATTLTLLVRGVTISSAYIDTGVTLRVGDLVLAGRQDASWFTFGRLAGVGTNEVLNPSFEIDGTRTGTPTNWTTYAISGAASISTQQTGYAPSGLYELVVSSGGVATDTFVYSSPISVVPGQVWALSALAAAIYPPGAPFDADIALYALWFANDTNLYPTTSAADTNVAQVNNIGPVPGHTSVSGSVTVPGGAVYMRVALRSILNTAVTEVWDSVVSRRIS